jgi:hypothetical protein
MRGGIEDGGWVRRVGGRGVGDLADALLGDLPVCVRGLKGALDPALPKLASTMHLDQKNDKSSNVVKHIFTSNKTIFPRISKLSAENQHLRTPIVGSLSLISWLDKQIIIRKVNHN